MADRTPIEWTDASWNPVTGCSKISPGCDHCYAERIAEHRRFRSAFPRGFALMLRPQRLLQPLHWRRPRMVFVNSMSDLFHKDIPPEYIARVFDTMERAHWHTYQVLTKRSSLMRDFLRRRYRTAPAPRHVWLGVSIEDGSRLSRLRQLQAAPAGVRFLSLEPLLGPIGNLDLSGISWVIVGGESGPQARPMQPQWARDIREQCHAAGVAFFMKQTGSNHSCWPPGISDKGGDPQQWPQDLRVREFPMVRA